MVSKRDTVKRHSTGDTVPLSWVGSTSIVLTIIVHKSKQAIEIAHILYQA